MPAPIAAHQYLKALETRGSLCWPAPIRLPIIQGRLALGPAGLGQNAKTLSIATVLAAVLAVSPARSMACPHPKRQNGRKRTPYMCAHAPARAQPFCAVLAFYRFAFLYLIEKKEKNSLKAQYGFQNGRGRHRFGWCKPLELLEKVGF